MTEEGTLAARGKNAAVGAAVGAGGALVISKASAAIKAAASKIGAATKASKKPAAILNQYNLRPRTSSPNYIGGSTKKTGPGQFTSLSHITGGRSTFDMVFAEEQRAIAMYAEIRSSTSDIKVIAKNLNMPEFQVRQIKEHILFNEHQLDHGLGNRRFDPDLPVADAWKRLESGLYNDSDIQILRHEHFEAKFESIFKTDYRTAHDAANRAGRPSGIKNSDMVDLKGLKRKK